MLDFLFNGSFMPHGYCLRWNTVLLWTHVLSDIGIALAYFSIPAMILYYLRKRQQISQISGPYLLIGLMFACFIVFCGLTHVFGLITIWQPFYGAQGVMKAATALISIATAISMVYVLPRALALRTPEELERINAALQDEVQQRLTREHQLEEKNQALEAEISARSRAEKQRNAAVLDRDQLQQTLNQLRATQARLVESEKLASVGKIMAGLAHELNTPVGVSLTAISVLENVNSEMLSNWKKEELTIERFESQLNANQDSIELISSSLKRATSLLESFKQISIDQWNDTPRQIALAEYATSVIKTVKLLKMASGNRIEIDCPSNLSITTFPGALSQVIINLLTNALTHAYKDSEGGRVSLRLRSTASDIELKCQDYGVGMTKDVQEKLFTPLFNENAHQRRTGIGLDIVSMLINDKLEGEIILQSAPGKGSSFTVHIPNLDIEAKTAGDSKPN